MEKVKPPGNWPKKTSIFCVPGRTGYPCTYPAGFGKTALYSLGLNPDSIVAHVCGGCADLYNDGFNTLYSMYHYRIDNDPAVQPEVLMDVRGVWKSQDVHRIWKHFGLADAAIVDPDYSEEWAAKHAGGVATWPDNLKQLTQQTFRIVKLYGRVGVLHWEIPELGSGYECMEKICIRVDRQKDRWFTVWMRRQPKEVRDKYYPKSTHKWDKKQNKKVPR